MKFYISSGGTGGHIFPAESVAEELISRGHEVIFITDERYKNYEGTKKSFSIIRIPSASPKGSLIKKIKATVAIFKGTKAAYKLLKNDRGAVVIGFGGYPSFPAIIAATLLRMKIIIHEQNSVLGVANQVLVWCADIIAISFDKVKGIPECLKSRIVKTGNPVRPGIAAIAESPFPEITDNGELIILVTGGSLGAKIFSQVIPQTIISLKEEYRSRIRLVQQVREEDKGEVIKLYQGIGLKSEVASFFIDIPEKLREAHLVIGRAGASTVAELAIAGRPSILVPYPNSNGDHQLLNARNLEKTGGAWVMTQEEFTAENLRLKLESFLLKPYLLKNAAQYVKGAAIFNAVKNLADLAQNIAIKDKF